MNSSTLRFVWGPATVLVLVPWSPYRTEAALVTYQFSGVVTDVSTPLSTSGGQGANGFDTGLKLQGTVTFNTLTQRTFIPPLPVWPLPDYDIYEYGRAITSLKVSVGTYMPSPIGNNDINVISGSRAAYHFLHQVTGDPVRGIAPSFFDEP